MNQVNISELKLGDVVRLSDGPFMDAIVSNIHEHEVVMLRAYMTSEDFSYTGGVICYTGLETIKYLKSTDLRFTLMQATRVTR